MSFVIGMAIIFFAFYAPGPTPTGIFWPALIVAIPSLIVGSYDKFNIRWFSLGVLLGSTIIVVVNYDGWGSLGTMLAVLQIIPTFASIISFLFGRVLFAHIRTRNKSLK